MFIFFFLIIFLTQCQDYEPHYYPSVIKKGYVAFNELYPLSHQYVYQRDQEIADARQRIITLDISNKIFNSLAQHYIDQPFHYYQLWREISKTDLSSTIHEGMLRNLYSIASIMPFHSFSKQFKCHNKLRFIEQSPMENIYDYQCGGFNKFNLDSPYVGVKYMDKNRENIYLKIYNALHHPPTLINTYYLGPCTKKFENYPYRTILNAAKILTKDCCGITLHSLTNSIWFGETSKQYSSIYLCQKKPNVFFLMGNRELTKGDLLDVNINFSLDHAYQDFNVFEQSDNSCILEFTRTDQSADCYHYDYKKNTIKKIDALSGLAEKFTHIEEFKDHYYVATINTASVYKKHVTGFVSKDSEKIIATCIDETKDNGYCYSPIMHLNGYLSGYSDTRSDRAERMYGIMLRFPLTTPFSKESRVEEFKYDIGYEKIIHGIYKTEYPATYLISYSLAPKNEHSKMHFDVLHFPLVEDYLAFQSLTDDQKRIKIKYEKRLYYLKQWYKRFISH